MNVATLVVLLLFVGSGLSSPAESTPSSSDKEHGNEIAVKHGELASQQTLTNWDMIRKFFRTRLFSWVQKIFKLDKPKTPSKDQFKTAEEHAKRSRYYGEISDFFKKKGNDKKAELYGNAAKEHEKFAQELKGLVTGNAEKKDINSGGKESQNTEAPKNQQSTSGGNAAIRTAAQKLKDGVSAIKEKATAARQNVPIVKQVTQRVATAHPQPGSASPSTIISSPQENVPEKSIEHPIGSTAAVKQRLEKLDKEMEGKTEGSPEELSLKQQIDFEKTLLEKHEEMEKKRDDALSGNRFQNEDLEEANYHKQMMNHYLDTRKDQRKDPVSNNSAKIAEESRAFHKKEMLKSYAKFDESQNASLGIGSMGASFQQVDKLRRKLQDERNPDKAKEIRELIKELEDSLLAEHEKCLNEKEEELTKPDADPVQVNKAYHRKLLAYYKRIQSEKDLLPLNKKVNSDVVKDLPTAIAYNAREGEVKMNTNSPTSATT